MLPKAVKWIRLHASFPLMTWTTVRQWIFLFEKIKLIGWCRCWTNQLHLNLYLSPLQGCSFRVLDTCMKSLYDVIMSIYESMTLNRQTSVMTKIVFTLYYLSHSQTLIMLVIMRKEWLLVTRQNIHTTPTSPIPQLGEYGTTTSQRQR